MQTGGLGKIYQNGETIIHQGAQGDCLYVIQEGKVEVFTKINGQEIHLTELGEGEFFGEMAVFEQTVRSTSVRALGRTRVLTVDKRTLLCRLEEDPSLAFQFLERMSTRIRGLSVQYAQMQSPKNRDFRNHIENSAYPPKSTGIRRLMVNLVSNSGISM